MHQPLVYTYSHEYRHNCQISAQVLDLSEETGWKSIFNAAIWRYLHGVHRPEGMSVLSVLFKHAHSTFLKGPSSFFQSFYGFRSGRRTSSLNLVVLDDYFLHAIFPFIVNVCIRSLHCGLAVYEFMCRLLFVLVGPIMSLRGQERMLSIAIATSHTSVQSINSNPLYYINLENCKSSYKHKTL